MVKQDVQLGQRSVAALAKESHELVESGKETLRLHEQKPFDSGPVRGRGGNVGAPYRLCYWYLAVTQQLS